MEREYALARSCHLRFLHLTPFPSVTQVVSAKHQIVVYQIGPARSGPDVLKTAQSARVRKPAGTNAHFASGDISPAWIAVSTAVRRSGRTRSRSAILARTGARASFATTRGEFAQMLLGKSGRNRQSALKGPVFRSPFASAVAFRTVGAAFSPYEPGRALSLLKGTRGGATAIARPTRAILYVGIAASLLLCTLLGACLASLGRDLGRGAGEGLPARRDSLTATAHTIISDVVRAAARAYQDSLRSALCWPLVERFHPRRSRGRD